MTQVKHSLGFPGRFNLLTSVGSESLARDSVAGFLSGTTLGAASDAVTYSASYGELETHVASVSGTAVMMTPTSRPFDVEFELLSNFAEEGETETEMNGRICFLLDGQRVGNWSRVVSMDRATVAVASMLEDRGKRSEPALIYSRLNYVPRENQASEATALLKPRRIG